MVNKSTKTHLPNLQNEANAKLANFVLPEDLSESTISVPAHRKPKPKPNWSQIVQEKAEELDEILEYKRSKEKPEVPSIFQDAEPENIRKQLFPFLIPSLEKMLSKAAQWKSFETQRNFFNGIDYLAECLWNDNPKRADQPHVEIFNMEWVKKHLKENPRETYPESWLWPEEYAAIVIQRNVRKYLVQKRPEVNEMRNFWKKLEFERANPVLQSNPMLAKHFASNWDLTTPKIVILEGEKSEAQTMTAKSVLNILGN